MPGSIVAAPYGQYFGRTYRCRYRRLDRPTATAGWQARRQRRRPWSSPAPDPSHRRAGSRDRQARRTRTPRPKRPDDVTSPARTSLATDRNPYAAARDRGAGGLALTVSSSSQAGAARGFATPLQRQAVPRVPIPKASGPIPVLQESGGP